MSRFENRVAIVTGGASGIGAGVATVVARDGAAVAVADINDDEAGRVADQIIRSGGTALAVHLDVSKESDWVEAVAQVCSSLGPPSLLHSNAALLSPEVMYADMNLIEVEVELWDRVMAVNLRGAMLACKHVVPHMISLGGGAIVLTSSITAISAPPDRAAYASSKGALMSLARVVASMYGDRHIRCNAVAPGVIETPAIAVISDELKQAIVDSNMLPRLGKVDDVAAAVSFLLSDDASFITAQVLVVDGGATTRFPRPRSH
jgi:NAD(P)-dependent dehydrogenase (short-subunit alcohol dehydrogenase family)